MARRRKKKKAALGNVLKYEIYGIILITLSVIALSGEAAVGRSLSKMFGLVLGKFYFVIPLIGIYYGLMVMIHRRWPHNWTTRKSGLVLAVLALTLMSSISAMEQRLSPVGALHPANVMSQIHIDMQEQLLVPEGQDKSMLHKSISGGYAGAVEFASLLWLFGLPGAKLVMVVMFVISFMLITNLSYVDLIRIFRTKVMTAGTNAFRRLQQSGKTSSGKKTGSRTKSRAVKEIPVYEDEDEDDLEEPAPARKQPVFFQLFGTKGKKDALSAAAGPEGNAVEPAYEERTQPVRSWDDAMEEELSSNALPAVLQPEAVLQTAAPSPIIRDFFDSIKSEDVSSYEDEELDHPDVPAIPSDSDLNETSSVGWREAEADPEKIGQLDSADEETGLIAGQSLSAVNPDKGEGTETVPAAPPPPPKPYRLPPFRLLSKPNNSGKGGDQNDYMQTARKLEATLESFGVRAKVLEVVRGPAVTRYEIQPDIGVKVSRIVSLTDDIALALAAKDIRMEAPIPGKSAIGIEVPNGEVSLVTMREVMETATFQEAESKLSIAFGRDISGQTIIGNLARMPHLLVAGATGSGKSVCINGIITSILYKAKPDEVKFLMVDPKMVELNVYNGIPHLMAPVVTDPKRASLALKKIVVEMEKRYELFSKSGTRNVEGYNKLMADNPDAVLPYIVVIVDELADLMMVAAGDVEDAIARLAQMARAAGIHLIIATQRPSVDVITGVIKANIPSRIAFGVSSQVDSRTILDMGGAEKLLGRGDMLFMPMGASKPVRVQGAFMSDQEVENIVEYVRGQGDAQYDESLVPEVDESSMEMDEMVDELFEQAVQILLEAKQASVSLLQRRMRIGYTRAARLIDSMEARGIIGPYEGSKPREVLISLEQYQQNKLSS
ncbi:DNA translocase FtsK [Paenibacillus sp. JX-17]|uniref:DNA translocase FtsK n=1 Tax=Paenibacillus lacisoli TaxID=3064525 RepID=A0ABT9CDK6_9BACL|nr:DNA translocase FtsK [Paenibacillus sp. JX-17]MDO7905771.1 DNA translocase FtsK [Paenibacillus sp. JX-17]